MMELVQIRLINRILASVILVFLLYCGTSSVVLAAQIGGFVWLDDNADGLQNEGELGFAQTVPGFGAANAELYDAVSGEFIVLSPLDESSNGLYQFDNVADGNYFVCVSNQFLEIDLTVTTPDAGDDSIDSDFDSSPCSYGIVVSGGEVVKRDLGLVGSTTTDSTGEIVINRVFVDYNNDGLASGLHPDVPGISFELYLAQTGELIQSAVSPGTSFQPLFKDLPTGNYFICAFRDIIVDESPVTLPVEATIPNAGDGGTVDESSDSDFITQTDGRVCTETITVIDEVRVAVGLGLSSTIVRSILVDQFCTLDDALKAVARANPIGFCPSGRTNGGFSTTAGTILLQESSQHDVINPLSPPTSVGSSLTTVKGQGQGAFVDVVRSIGRPDSDKFADLTIENLTVNVANANGARLVIKNSTVLENLTAEFRGSFVSIQNSTICGVFVESLVFTFSNNSENNPCNGTNSGNQISGFVWLDNNGDGLQSDGEPGFAQTVPSFGAPNVELYNADSGEFIGLTALDENSNGLYQFDDIADGNYFVCVSNQFLELDLTVTTPDAGDDSIDSDFDSSPCSYGIVVSGEQRVKRDLGLAATNQPTDGQINETSMD